MTKRNQQTLWLALLCSVLMGTQLRAADDYYKEPPLFHFYPTPDAPHCEIRRFGPVGIGLDLRKPNFTMHIVNVEEGSPAAACGELKKGQIIESINGQTIKDIDPRIILGNLITEAEAKDGIMKMMVKDDPEAAAREVIVKIPVLGAYSETWPVNCKKSDRIVRTFADFLAKNKESISIGIDGSLLFMLSTGEEKDLEVARGWVKKLVEKYKDKEQIESYPWFVGYSGPALCEYYLRTGDKSILPIIEKLADYLRREIYHGSWMGRGGATYGYMGGGHMNAAGVHCVTFLLMAKECGAKVDEHTLQTSLRQVFRFSGHGSVPYGNGLPNPSLKDNGKTTGLAFAMQAAANLHPDGEKSVYAKARDISAAQGFYSTSWLFHGHTGGGIGELWRGLSMGIIKEKRPQQYRSFMDGRRWMYELARTHDGVFGWVSHMNVSYTETAKDARGWGTWIPLIYTLPRKQLRLFGAPKSKYSKTYRIPDRPWGNAADDQFYSLTPGEYAPGKRLDISKERLATDSAWPLECRLGKPETDDETILMYAHHIDQGIRKNTAKAINRRELTHLVVPLLKSKDPRGRHTGLSCITGIEKCKPMPIDKVTDEMFSLAAGMIEDPDEAWWVVHAAMNALGRASAEQVAPHFKALRSWLDHDDWWLRNAAINALTPLVADKRFYKEILSRVAEICATDTVGKTQIHGIFAKLGSADPEIQQFALEAFAGAYTKFPKTVVEPGGQELTKNIPFLIEGIAKSIVSIPGGYDELYRIAPSRYPDAALPHSQMFLDADTSKFGPELRKAIVPIILNDVIPEYIKKNRKGLEKEISTRQPHIALLGKFARGIDGLVGLYRRAGIHDYDWKLYGPARDKIEWQYLTFDPPEKKVWGAGHRYRKVTLPEGCENWFTAEFDPKKAGWKTGRAPFANIDGKLAPFGTCKGDNDFCGCGNPPNTFWDKEVILMRAEIELPPMRDGYAYRLMVGGRSHYDAGGGTSVWIDGEHMAGRSRTGATIGPGSGSWSHRPFYANIADAYRKHFEDGKIILACDGFLRWGWKVNYIKCYKTFWFEEMKLPELPDAE